MGIRKNQCRQDGCNKQSTYAFEGNKPQFCGQHRQSGMFNVRNKRCADCKSQALFAIEGHKPQYCRTHHETGMINVVHKHQGFVVVKTRHFLQSFNSFQLL